MKTNHDNLNESSKHVPDLLMLSSNNGDNNQNDNIHNIFKNSFDDFTNNSQNGANYVPEAYIQTKFAEVQSDVTTQFEVANKLKNYATVNITEPIPTQLSYNIGSENIEDGKDGETLENTEVGLEENSIITEIENAGINLYDIDLNDRTNSQSFQNSLVDNFEINSIFNSSSDDEDRLLPVYQQNKDNYEAKTNVNPNVNIISVQTIRPPKVSLSNEMKTQDVNVQETESNLINLYKQIYTPEALEMSLACEEEVPSTWIDVMDLMNNSRLNIFEHSSVDENQVRAVLTGIQSYIDMEVPQTNAIKSNFSTTETQSNNIEMYFTNTESVNTSNLENESSHKEETTNVTTNLENTNTQDNTNFSNTIVQSVIDVSTTMDINILKNITADADICKCVDCKCGPYNNCQDCEPTEKITNSPKQDTSCCMSKNLLSSNCCCAKESSQSSPNVNPKNCSNKMQCLSKNVQAQNIVDSLDKRKEDSDCCVVVCLKSLDQLKKILTFGSSYGNFQALTLGCVSNDMCAIKK
ncbi:hypothetical protein ILUMI_03511 [Ignelater luminosus]|uniref:Uncharacterized protein n=1 Tax=Ignelater luminosus TaxID=2038154 RepID=A0A8K0DAN1_IGNLU|nr:hypothetical protein ILUMI_03511 [Ignelater luminosus]